jgi:hypothetical protein
MNALDLMARLGGEILNNKIRVYVEGEIVIIARLEDQDWILTDRGILLANEHSNLAVAEAAPAPTKTRKKETTVVESVESQDEIAIEIEPTPEQ